MAFTLADHLKTPHAALTAEDVLRAPVDVLLGVPAAARAALEAVNVRTVFDLAASELFATAALLLAAETDPTLAESRLNVAAADAVSAPPGIPIGEWARRGLSLLADMTTQQAAALGTALDVTTIRDLALWPPFVVARTLLQETFAGVAPAVADLESPGDLQPTSGSYATERVFFRRLVIDLAQQADQGATPVEGVAGVDLTAALAAPTAFQRLATGALLTFKQSWFSRGVTLGQLLHSLSLAPGESTRVAIVDWTRRTRTSATETIDEREQLANEQMHTRALNEVTSATATEFQAGSSTTSVTSTTSQGGAAFGIEIGPLALGGSHGSSSSTTEAMSASSSFGARDLAASLSQSINDRTQQHASSSRSRRASAVREVSQTEHESISTRVVTNYNHMHALTVQYYETVQAYRVTTELDRAERCLFVPLKLLNFKDAATVDRLRTTLAEAALTPGVFRQLTSEYGTVEVVPQTPRVTPGTVVFSDLFVRGDVVGPVAGGGAAGGGAVGGGAAGGGVVGGGAGGGVVGGGGAGGTIVGGAGGPRGGAIGGGLIRDPNARTDLTALASTSFSTAGLTTLTGIHFEQAPANTPTAIAAVKGWNLAQLNFLGSMTGRLPLRPGSDSVFLPHDARLLGVALRQGQAARFEVKARDNAELPAQSSTATTMVLASAATIGSLQSIGLQNAEDRDITTTLALSVSVEGSVVTIDVPVRFRSKAAVAGVQDVIKFGAVGPAPELVQHLEANRLHYSRAVFMRLDAAAIAGLLSRFTYRGLSLGRVVDPRPVAATANFLVFKVNVPRDGALEDDRFQAEQREFKAFLESRGLDRPAPQSQIVPLPSEGVFAEAVLGRFNSAEKIDLKRFWNWQDSPIPITAPDIAAIEAGSRAEAETLRPGQLGAPVVTIQSPTALPAAAGVGPMLQAIQAANLFRDMSGMAQTAALAQSAVQASGAGATSAGDLAAQNLKTVMEQHTARMRIAADMLGSVLSPAAAAGGAAGAGGAGAAPAGRGTVSERGGQLGAAAAIDEKAAAGATAGSGQGAAGGAPPESLESQTLKQQTGGDLTESAEKLAENATKPVAESVPPKRRTRRRTGTTTTPSGPAPGTPTNPLENLPAPSGEPQPTTVRMTVRYLANSGGQIDGASTAMVSDGTTAKQIGFGTSVSGQPIVVEFRTESDKVFVSLVSFTLGGAPFAANKTLTIPRGGGTLGSILAGLAGSVQVTLDVRPVVRTRTLTVPFTALGLPDRDNLEAQLAALGVPPMMRIGDPDFVFTPPSGYKTTVKSFTGALSVKLVL